MALTEKERNWFEDRFEKLNDRITEVRVDIAGLKVKSGIFGVIGGVIPVTVLLCIYLLLKL